MLTAVIIEQILAAIPHRTIGVFGDLFLDRYLDLDAALTEPSIETGLDAYQVVRVRSYPGAAGTVINNLAALGVGRIVPISMIGDDGEGHELRQALKTMTRVELAELAITTQRRTPTYTKPMLMTAGQAPRELNRLDIKNRLPLPADVERKVLDSLTRHWHAFDALLVLDQVSELGCGVVTERVRDRLAELGSNEPYKIVIVDSRERIGLFRNVCFKPNESECLRASPNAANLCDAMKQLVQKTRRPVACTCGAGGIMIADADGAEPSVVPAYPVAGPIDTVGAGDASSAALACALACGVNWQAAAAFANLVASIAIQQIGVTGTATPEQVRQRWRTVSST